uniref:Uncharacterized protein n=1 Tax=Macrostomum lignano TaxID=282301 RepID=A0A1I8JPA0_9PLAT
MQMSLAYLLTEGFLLTVLKNILDTGQTDDRMHRTTEGAMRQQREFLLWRSRAAAAAASADGRPSICTWTSAWLRPADAPLAELMKFRLTCCTAQCSSIRALAHRHSHYNGSQRFAAAPGQSSLSLAAQAKKSAGECCDPLPSVSAGPSANVRQQHRASGVEPPELDGTPNGSRSGDSAIQCLVNKNLPQPLSVLAAAQVHRRRHALGAVQNERRTLSSTSSTRRLPPPLESKEDDRASDELDDAVEWPPSPLEPPPPPPPPPAPAVAAANSRTGIHPSSTCPPFFRGPPRRRRPPEPRPAPLTPLREVRGGLGAVPHDPLGRTWTCRPPTACCRTAGATCSPCASARAPGGCP